MSTLQTYFAGVGRNIAEVLGRLGVQPLLYSAVGADHRGTALLNELTECGVIYEPGLSVTVVNNASTSTFLAMLDTHGDLHAAIADMTILQQIPVPSIKVLDKARFLVIDANPPIEKMIEAAKRAVSLGVSVFFEPTSVPKAKAAFRSNDFVSCLTFASPNAEELMAMAHADDRVSFTFAELNVQTCGIIRDAATRVLMRMMPGACLIITLGANGVLLASKDDKTPDRQILFSHFPAEVVHVANTTGGGDSLVGAFLKAIIDGKDQVEAIIYAQKIAAQCITYQKAAISPFIK